MSDTSKLVHDPLWQAEKVLEVVPDEINSNNSANNTRYTEAKEGCEASVKNAKKEKKKALQYYEEDKDQGLVGDDTTFDQWAVTNAPAYSAATNNLNMSFASFMQTCGLCQVKTLTRADLMDKAREETEADK